MPTTSATCCASAKAREPVPQPASRAASFPENGAEEPPDTLREIGTSPLLQCEPQLDAHGAASSSMSRQLARERERFVARRDRPRAALLDGVEDTPIAGPVETELVAADERYGRIRMSRGLDDTDELRNPDERKRVDCPRLGCTAKAVDRARRRVVGFRALRSARATLQLFEIGSRRREAPEDGDEPEVGVVEAHRGARRAVRRRREETHLVEAAIPGCREPLEPPRARALPRAP